MNSIPVKIINQLFKTIPDLNDFERIADDYMAYFKNNPITSVQYKRDGFQYNYNYRMLKINAKVAKCAINERKDALPV
jgi:hypothetical protein